MVPNCPGWTVYHAASHIGRVAIAWKAMILATPDDPDSRVRGYAVAGELPTGTLTGDLGALVHDALDQLVDNADAASYFSMTGGHGTRRLWARHAAAELGMHQLDVEAALSHPHQMSDQHALDALAYSSEFFLPAMRTAAGEDPGAVSLQPTDADGNELPSVELPSEAAARVRLRGAPVDLLLAMWGRPFKDVEVSSGDRAVLDHWRDLPAQAFQFGAWD